MQSTKFLMKSLVSYLLKLLILIFMLIIPNLEITILMISRK
jgi:hypothetical protein